MYLLARKVENQYRYSELKTSKMENIRYTKGDFVMINGIPNPYSEDLGECEPMPITEDLIHRNGFEKKEGFRKKTYTMHFFNKVVSGNKHGKRKQVVEFLTRIDGSILIYAKILGMDCKFEGVVRYMHQIQQALRLCGYSEYVDNMVY